MEGVFSKKILSKVKNFYENYPYPLQPIKSKKDLLSKKHTQAMKRIFSTIGVSFEFLNSKQVLDGGCGTGEKAIFCSFFGAKTDAFDVSKTSIKIAKELSKNLSIRVNFMNTSFEEFDSDKKYDLILCIGSLHHTENPKKNFLKMASYLKNDGFIVVGLYNLYGRLACRIKRKFLRILSGENPSQILSKIKAKKEDPHMLALLADRYASPYETYHTIEEVLSWFLAADIEPIGCYPKVNIKSFFDIKFSQFEWLLKRKGFFFLGGRKR